MKLIPTAIVLRHHSRVQSKLADAVAALKIADAKLGQAVDEYEDTDSYLDTVDLWEAQLNARIFAEMLEPIEAPTLPPRVFREIAEYANKEPRNASHLEGALLALKLAERSLESALDLSEQLDGDEIDAAFEAVLAARGTIRSYASTFECSVIPFDHERVLDAILATKRTLILSASAMVMVPAENH
jgi:hypothetical protein